MLTCFLPTSIEGPEDSLWRAFILYSKRFLLSFYLIISLTMLVLPYAALAASGLGVASHLGFFIRGEHQENGIHLLRAAVLLPSLCYLYLFKYASFSHLQALLYTTTIFWSFTLSLWASMLIYRGFFHPLRNFPGPTGAKYSKFWHSFKAADFHWYKTVNSLHQQYGDFVRTGRLSSGTLFHPPHH